MARFIANSIRILALIQIICFAISNGQQTFVNIPTATEDYNLNYFIEGNEITLNITGTGKGYIGFGFSNISGMVSADIFIGGVSDSGEPYFGVKFPFNCPFIDKSYNCNDKILRGP